MRYTTRRTGRIFSNGISLTKIFCGALSMLGLLGCVAKPSPELAMAQSQMDGHNYAAVQTSTDAVIAKNARGSEAAQAYYLKGRAIEQSSFDNAADAGAKWQEARTAYIAALAADGPHGPLEAYIRAAISNVSYWQEDYTTAAQQGLAAGPLLGDPTAAGWTFYRAGLSLQRLGQFAAADAAFARAVAAAPGTDPALRAQAHKGVRAFNVRILFDSPAAAAQAATELSRKGMVVARHDQTAGAAAELMAGSFGTYAAATAARAQLLATYPNAAVVP